MLPQEKQDVQPRVSLAAGRVDSVCVLRVAHDTRSRSRRAAAMRAQLVVEIEPHAGRHAAVALAEQLSMATRAPSGRRRGAAERQRALGDGESPKGVRVRPPGMRCAPVRG